MLPGLRLLLTTDAVGGVWRYTADLSRGLSERGWQVTVAVVGPAPGGAQRREMAEGVPIVATNLPLDWLVEDAADFGRYAMLAALADGTDLALLHAPALLGECDWPVPVAVMAHSCLTTWFAAVRGGPVPPGYARRADIAATGFRRADAVAAPTRSFAGTIRTTYCLPLVTAIHGGRTPFVLPEVRRERAVLTAGRLWDDGKNVAVLDQAAAGLSAPFRAAGSAVGPQGARSLESLHLLGSLDEQGMAEVFAGHAVFASASVYEPFGLAVLEAAQAGLALVLSDIPSFRELWDGAAAFVPPHDAGAWRAALEQALDAPEAAAERAQVRAARYGAAAMVESTAAWLAGVAA